MPRLWSADQRGPPTHRNFSYVSDVSDDSNNSTDSNILSKYNYTTKNNDLVLKDKIKLLEERLAKLETKSIEEIKPTKIYKTNPSMLKASKKFLNMRIG